VKNWQPCALFFSAGLFALLMLPSSGAATLPSCKAGIKSTKAHPCKARAKKATTTTPQPAPPPVQDPGNTGGRVSNGDATTIVRVLDPQRGLYQLEVQNTSGIGYINTFTWNAPDGLTITAVTSSEGGHCQLVSGAISCTGGGKGITPPGCTCEPGGKMTVNFTATGNQPTFADGHWTTYGIVGATLQITVMTPVPYHVPSYIPTPSTEDLPTCAKGQTSTKAKPCANV
jgi:hypothetical protein